MSRVATILRWGAPWAVGSGLLLAACHTFEAVDPAAPPAPGTAVRAELVSSSSVETWRPPTVSDEPRSGQRFRGEFMSWSPDTLTMFVVSPGTLPQFDTLHIPTRLLSRVEVMELDGTKTGLVVAASLATAGVLLATRASSSGGTPPEGPGEGNEGGFRLPLTLFRIFVPD